MQTEGFAGHLNRSNGKHYRQGGKSEGFSMEETLGAIVQRHRKRSGLSRERLAEIAGVGKTVIYDIEHGRESVRYTNIRKVLYALNIKIRFVSPLEEASDEKG